MSLGNLRGLKNYTSESSEIWVYFWDLLGGLKHMGQRARDTQREIETEAERQRQREANREKYKETKVKAHS